MCDGDAGERRGRSQANQPHESGIQLSGRMSKACAERDKQAMTARIANVFLELGVDRDVRHTRAKDEYKNNKCGKPALSKVKMASGMDVIAKCDEHLTAFVFIGQKMSAGGSTAAQARAG